MTIVTLVAADPTNPIEISAWLAANPSAVLFSVLNSQNVFYVFVQ